MASGTDLATLKQDSFHVARFMRNSFQELRTSKRARGSYAPPTRPTANEDSEHDAEAPGGPGGPHSPHGPGGPAIENKMTMD